MVKRPINDTTWIEDDTLVLEDGPRLTRPAAVQLFEQYPEVDYIKELSTKHGGMWVRMQLEKDGDLEPR